MNFAAQLFTEGRSSRKIILLNNKCININYLDNLLKLWGKLDMKKSKGLKLFDLEMRIL